jgi:protein-S-isoprenylcysteine O-methyltransferase Ste14
MTINNTDMENKKKGYKLRLIIKAIRNTFLALLFFGISLFLPADTLRFWNAWLFLGVFILSMFFILMYIFIHNPDLMEKRMRGSERENPQKIIMTLLILSVLLTFVVAGFDFRYHWSTVPAFLMVLSTLIMLIGFIMLFMVTLQNSYASHIIEIQEEQKLIDTGLYSIVRHPMYLAYLIIFIVTPFILGSYYALIPMSFILLFLGFRLVNEEKILNKGLQGYDLYMKKVRYRLIPYIW